MKLFHHSTALNNHNQYTLLYLLDGDLILVTKWEIPKRHDNLSTLNTHQSPPVQLCWELTLVLKGKFPRDMTH